MSVSLRRIRALNHLEALVSTQEALLIARSVTPDII